MNKITMNVSVMAIMTVMTVGACGGGDVSVGSAPTDTGNTTSSLPMPAHEELPTPPAPSAEWSRPNPNDKSTALGRLCWVRREVATHVINLHRAQFGEGDNSLVPEDEANAAVARFKEMLPTVSGELGSDDGLSGELKAYRNRLIQAAAEAERVLRDVPARSSRADRSQAFRRLGAEQGVLDFSRFPGAAEFAAAAEADRSSCREI